MEDARILQPIGKGKLFRNGLSLRDSWAMPAIVVMSVWQSLGINIIIFLAGLQAINQLPGAGVEVRREMGRDETFYAIDKARRLVGFEPQHSWRDVLADPEGNEFCVLRSLAPGHFSL